MSTQDGAVQVSQAAHETVHVAASRVHSCCSVAELGARSAIASSSRAAMPAPVGVAVLMALLSLRFVKRAVN